MLAAVEFKAIKLREGLKKIKKILDCSEIWHVDNLT